MSTVISWLFPVFLAVVGLSGLMQAFRAWRRAVAAQHWPIAQGRVTTSTVDKAWTPEKTDYWIKYEYTVDGHKYTGNTITFGPPIRPNVNKRRAQLSHYAVGKRVPVYYDPHNPERAVLERHIPWGQITLLVAGALVAFTWAALLVFPAS